MSLVDFLTSDLMIDEGLRLVVYDDATGDLLTTGSTIVGHPTIGYGRCLDLAGITTSEAEYLLENNIASTILWCSSLSYWQGLSINRQRVIGNMVFALGSFGFSQFHDLDAALKANNYEAAAEAMLNSKWSLQAPARSARLAALMRQG